jgi:phytoene dehydrogenase-like protein
LLLVSTVPKYSIRSILTNNRYYVGAGAGGVAIAARLAKEGFTVTVVEKNNFIGGRCSLIQEDGYVCSTFYLVYLQLTQVGRDLTKDHPFFYCLRYLRRPF